jgi:aspartate carbamoyltransferase catalytic subunit
VSAHKTLARLSQRHLLGIESLSQEDIELVLANAKKYQTRVASEIRPVPRLDLLKGKNLVLAFFEPSTRTRVSFEIAAQRLGMDVVNLAMEGSSVQKGESLLDTVKTLVAMRPDALVVRHRGSGVPHFLAQHTEVPILNAGDGTHEHPTQALLDALTIIDHKGRLKGLKVAILGDILHSRVARSNIHLLSKYGVEIVLGGPPPLVPTMFERLATPAGTAVCVAGRVRPPLLPDHRTSGTGQARRYRHASRAVPARRRHRRRGG